MTSQNIYEYKKIKPLDINELVEDILYLNVNKETRHIIRGLLNKINELIIEQNRIVKDFELYKKAFKRIHPENKC